MIIYDIYKIEKDRSDYSLWELVEIEECVRRDNKLIKTGNAIKRWEHIGYYGSPWNAFKKLIQLKSWESFDNSESITDLILKIEDLERFVNNTITDVLEGLKNE